MRVQKLSTISIMDLAENERNQPLLAAFTAYEADPSDQTSRVLLPLLEKAVADAEKEYAKTLAEQQSDKAQAAELIQTKIKMLTAEIDTINERFTLPTLPELVTNDIGLSLQDTDGILQSITSDAEFASSLIDDVIESSLSHYPMSRSLLMTPLAAEFVVNSYTTSDQKFPKVAASNNGSFVITWVSSGQDASGDGVYGQVYNSSAARLGSEFRVNSYTSSDQNGVALSIAQNGEAYIAWGSNQDTNSIAMTNPCTFGTLCHYVLCGSYHEHNYYLALSSCTFGSTLSGAGIAYSLGMNQLSFGIYYNRFSNNIPLAVESQVNTQGINNQQNPTVATLQNGDTLIVWESSGSLSYSTACTGTVQYSCTGTYQYYTANDTFTGVTTPQDGSGFGIFARRFSPIGNYGPDFQINTFITGDQQLPAVAAYADGRSVIVWQSQAQDGSGWGIYGQRLTATGTRLGSEFSVNSYVTGDQINPAVATTSSNQFVVVWQSAAQDGSGYGIYGRLFDTSANPGTEFRVNTYTLNDQINPAITTFSTGEFIVVWQSAGQDASGYGIYGQRFSAEGLPYGSEFQLNSYTTNDQINPSIASFNDGGFVATWGSTGQDAAGSCVVARVYRNLPLPTLSARSLNISEDGSILVTPSIFNVSGDHPLTQLKITITGLVHGSFLLAPQNNSVTEFSQQAILNGQIYFVHDHSESAPAFNLTASDGFVTLPLIPANISYTPINDPPTILHNIMVITQGQTVQVTSDYLQATDPDSSVPGLNFIISDLQHGVFRSSALANATVTNFLQGNITVGDIYFVHDGSSIPPAYNVSVSDGLLTSSPQAAVISFNGFAIVNNQLSIAEGQAVVLTINNLQAVTSTNTPANQLIFIASNIQHGQFERLTFPTVAITTFSLQEIQFNSIRFVHDNSENAPSYDMALSDGTTFTTPRAATITYTSVNNPPVLGNHQLTLVEGENITISANELNATDRDNSADSLLFIITNLQHGSFVTTNGGIPVASFLQQQVTSSGIMFEHDGSNTAPSFLVTVSDGQLSTTPQIAEIQFTAVNDAPVIDNNELTITQGTAVTLSNTNLKASDEETASDDLVFTISNITHGQFEYVTAPKIPVTTFSQDKISRAEIRFVHDGSAKAPSYGVSVSDGELSSTPSQALINFNTKDSGKIASGNNVENAIIAGVISGAIGLIFLAMRIYISRKVNKELDAILLEKNDATSPEGQRAHLDKNVIRPIAKKIFEQIKTSKFFGYRSERDTQDYFDAIVVLVTKLESEGVDLTMKGKTPSQQLQFLNEIIQEIRRELVTSPSYCSCAYASSFFKAEITPKQLEDAAESIAKAVCARQQQPGKTPTVGDDVEVEMSDLKEGKSPRNHGLRLLDSPSRQRSSSTDQRFEAVEQQVKGLNTKFDGLNETMNSVVTYLRGDQTVSSTPSMTH